MKDSEKKRNIIIELNLREQKTFLMVLKTSRTMARRVVDTSRATKRIKVMSKPADRVNIEDIAERLGAKPPIDLSMIKDYTVLGDKLLIVLEEGAKFETSNEDDLLVFKGHKPQSKVIFKEYEVKRVYIQETGEIIWP